MKLWRRWIALALAAVLCCTLLAGCGEEGEEGAALSVCVGVSACKLLARIWRD